MLQKIINEHGCLLLKMYMKIDLDEYIWMHGPYMDECGLN